MVIGHPIRRREDDRFDEDRSIERSRLEQLGEHDGRSAARVADTDNRPLVAHYIEEVPSNVPPIEVGAEAL